MIISLCYFGLQVVTTTLESVGVSTTGNGTNLCAVHSFLSLGPATNTSETLTGISAKLYTDFTGPGNWEVFPDVHPALQQLKGDGISLGVVSNFDERLGKHTDLVAPYFDTAAFSLSTGMILSQLDLAHYFDFVLSSYEAKCFKPDSRLVWR